MALLIGFYNINKGGQETGDAVNSNDYDGLFKRANSRFNAKDYTGAISDYTKVIEHNSNDISTFIYRGMARFNLKDFQGSADDYFSAFKIYYHKIEGSIMAQEDTQISMHKNYGSKLGVNISQDFNLILERAKLEFQLKNYEAALIDINRIILLSPTDEAKSLKNDILNEKKETNLNYPLYTYFNADKLLQQGIQFFNSNNSEAEFYLFEASRLKPSLLESFYYLGLLHTSNNHYLSAVHNYDELLKNELGIDSKFHNNTLSNRGICKFMMGDKESAKIDLEKACSSGIKESCDALKLQ